MAELEKKDKKETVLSKDVKTTIKSIKDISDNERV